MPQFNTPAVRPGQPSVPIGATDRSAQPFQHNTALGLEPVLSFPNPILKNLMFYVDEQVTPNQLPKYVLGSKFQPKSGLAMGLTEGMRAAVLTHIEPVQTQDTKNIYRFFYVVPPVEQYRYNIMSHKKDRDGYTLNTTGTDGKFFNGTQPEDELKTFHDIQRTFVYLRSEVPVSPAIGSFDPSNVDLDPDYESNHKYTGFDAQLVHEEQVPFEEDYLNKIFVRIVRFYKTMPGPVVKELIPVSQWTAGQTVFDEGGPGDVGKWRAQNAQRWSREVWGFPENGTNEFDAQVPYMPQEALDVTPFNDGWDKGSFPALQLYIITGMIKSFSNIVINSKGETESGDCCNPPSAFVRCVNTTKTTSQNVDWGANGDLPPVVAPGKECSKWSTSTDVVVREGHSQKETVTTCTTYETVDELWESQVDQLTGNVFPVRRVLVKEPTLDFIANYEKEGFTKEVDALGNTYYVRRPKPSKREVPYEVPDNTFTPLPLNLSDFSVTQSGPYQVEWMTLGGNVVAGTGSDTQGLIGTPIEFVQEGPASGSRVASIALKYKGKNVYTMPLIQSYPDETSPGPGNWEWANNYDAPNPDGPWFSDDGIYKLEMATASYAKAWGSNLVGQPMDILPMGENPIESISQADYYSSKVKFTYGSPKPSNITPVLYVKDGILYMNIVCSDWGGDLSGNYTILIDMNSKEVAKVGLTISNTSQKAEGIEVSTEQGEDGEYVSGNYVFRGKFLKNITVTRNKDINGVFQFAVQLAVLKGNVYEVTETDEVPTLVVRQFVNPCFAVDSYMQLPGQGYYRKYTTVENFSFPPVLGNFGIYAWNTRPALNGQEGGAYFVNSLMERNGYSGPCTAIVEEVYSPNRTLPAGWGLGVDVQYTTNSGSFQSPLVTCNFPACLHPQINIAVTVGNNDAKWVSGNTNYTWPGTTHTRWKPVTMVYVQNRGVGILAKKVTINPPA